MRRVCGLIVMVLGAALPAAGELAHLVADLEAGLGPNASLQLQGVTAIGDRVVFSTYDPADGRDHLWTSDGTAPGTTLLAPGLTNVRLLRALGDGLVFAATSARVSGLWTTDGTTAGTRRLTPLGVSPGLPEDIAFSGSRLWFFAGSAAGPTLWTSDGTPEGTVPRVALGQREVLYPTAAGERVFFFASEGFNTPSCGGGPHCEEDDLLVWKLWVSDGTARGTRPLRTIGTFLGLGIAVDGHSRRAAGEHFFYVDRTQTPAELAELWASDGTPRGTVAVGRFPRERLVYGTESMRSLAGRIFFAAPTAAGVELWVSNGTRGGTRPVTSLPGEDPFAAFGFILPEVNELGGLFTFAAATPEHGIELWATDGRPQSTRQVADLCPGPCSSSFASEARVGPWLIGAAADEDGSTRLWRTDGTAGGTSLLFDPGAGPNRFAGSACTVDGMGFFSAATGGASSGIWQTDGTPAGTRQVSFPPGTAAKGSPDCPVLARLGRTIFFLGSDPVYGTEVWVADGRPEGTHILTDLATGSGPSSQPLALTAFGDQTLFFACTANEPGLWATRGEAASTERLLTLPTDCATFYGNLSFEQAAIVVAEGLAFVQALGTLWVTDGTPEGTARLASDDGAFAALTAREVVATLGGIAFLGHYEFDVPPERTRVELWVSDGTAAGTRRLAALPETSLALGLRSVGNRLFWSELRPSPTSQDRYELRTAELAGGAPESLTALTPFFAGGTPNPIELGGRYYFQHGDLIWATNGTAAGTAPLTTLIPDPCFQPSGGLTRWRDALYFVTANFCTEEGGLWRTDGTPEGTALLHTFAPLAAFDLGSFVEFGGELLFTLDNFARPSMQLWATDGTPGGTRPRTGELPLTHLGLFTAGGRLFFFGQDRDHGTELWTSDGTAAGTRLVQDVNPGPNRSFVGETAATGSRLDFAADDGLRGREVWSLPLTAVELCPPRAGRLCLAGGRFAVEATFQGRGRPLATASALPLTSQTGAFSFWNAALPDLVVKVLDAQAGGARVFAASLSDAAFDLTITNTATGEARRFHNALGHLTSFETAAP